MTLLDGAVADELNQVLAKALRMRYQDDSVHSRVNKTLRARAISGHR